MNSPLSYRIEPDTRRVHVTYRLQPSFEQWAAGMGAILRDPKFVPGFGFLLDRSRIPRPVKIDYIRQMVEFIEGHDAQSGGAYWAIVVVDLGSFGMARMAEILASSGKIRAFLQMEEAKAWLDASANR